MASLSVQTPRPERALTKAQKRALLAMPLDRETPATQIADATGMKANGVALALHGLERRGLVRRIDENGAVWQATFAGRGLAKRLA